MKRQITLSLSLVAAILVSTNSLAETELSQAQSMVASFEKLFGVTSGKRRNHTKGFCFDARFEPSGAEIKKYSSSALFADTSAVVGRFSHKGGNAKAQDHKAGDLGMALAFTTASGERHLMALNTLDFFPVATPEAFAQLMHAKTEGKEAVKAFKAKSTDLQRFKAHAATKPKTMKSLENAKFNSINSFYLVSADGDKSAVRWQFTPKAKHDFKVEPAEDFFYANMSEHLKHGALVWDMNITFANDKDDVDNAAIAWSGERTTILAGSLTIKSVSLDEGGECNNINYDPLVLSKGFEASSDPLLQARRSTYAISNSKRLQEQQ